jgi:Holliday junction resolvase
MGAKSTRKGKVGELEVASLLREHGIEARRGRQYQGGPDSPDVQCELPGWHLEVKRVETFSLYPALEQAQEEAPGGCKAVVFHRRSRKGWVVVLRAEDFIELVNRKDGY